MRTIVIDPVTRIEGHAKITIHLDDEGKVAETAFHVTQVRGFEKFTEGRPFYEMPAITARICGICPISHLLASVKACDAIMSVRIPPAAVKLRELLHCAQIVQSHALSFFHLSSPDLLLGFDSDPARRNIIGVIEDHPELAKDGIALRKFGQQAIEGLAGILQPFTSGFGDAERHQAHRRGAKALPVPACNFGREHGQNFGSTHDVAAWRFQAGTLGFHRAFEVQPQPAIGLDEREAVPF